MSKLHLILIASSSIVVIYSGFIYAHMYAGFPFRSGQTSTTTTILTTSISIVADASTTTVHTSHNISDTLTTPTGVQGLVGVWGEISEGPVTPSSFSEQWTTEFRKDGTYVKKRNGIPYVHDSNGIIFLLTDPDATAANGYGPPVSRISTGRWSIVADPSLVAIRVQPPHRDNFIYTAHLSDFVTPGTAVLELTPGVSAEYFEIFITGDDGALTLKPLPYGDPVEQYTRAR